MILLGNLLIAVGEILHSLVFLFYIIFFGYVIISWVNADPYNPIVRFINLIADPICSYIRRYVKPIGVLDLSPLIAFFLLIFIDKFLVASMMQYGAMAVRSGGGIVGG